MSYNDGNGGGGPGHETAPFADPLAAVDLSIDLDCVNPQDRQDALELTGLRWIETAFHNRGFRTGELLVRFLHPLNILRLKRTLEARLSKNIGKPVHVNPDVEFGEFFVELAVGNTGLALGPKEINLQILNYVLLKRTYNAYYQGMVERSWYQRWALTDTVPSLFPHVQNYVAGTRRNGSAEISHSDYTFHDSRRRFFDSYQARVLGNNRADNGPRHRPVRQRQYDRCCTPGDPKWGENPVDRFCEAGNMIW